MIHLLRSSIKKMRVSRSWPVCLASLFIGTVYISASHAAEKSDSNARVVAADMGSAPSRSKESQVQMTIGGKGFTITLANTQAARAFAARLPLTLDMTDLNGNEKKFDLPTPLPADASRPGTIRNGDLMLYGSNTVVIFYLTFDSSYSYTRLGHVDDPAALAKALGSSDARVEFTRNER